MKKRLLSLALSFVMLLTMLPVSVWAEEDTAEMNEVVMHSPETVTAQTVTVSDSGPSNDELFMGYIYQLADIEPEEETAPEESSFIVRHEAMGAVALNKTSQKVYDSLAKQIKTVAANGGGTDLSYLFGEFSYPYEDLVAYADYEGTITDENGDIMSWPEYRNKFQSNDDFAKAIASLLVSNEIGDALQEFNFSSVLNALLATLPYEMYWYDKTVGVYSFFDYHLDISGDREIVTSTPCFEFYFCAASAYLKNNARVVPISNDGKTYSYYLDVDSGLAQEAADVAAKAKAVVDNASNLTDRDKLQAYLTYVDGQVSYNNDAANAANNVSYGDPWQLIYVFDDNPNTNVVCEGYAKAFKFLCDLSTWSDVGFDCRLATGLMVGGTGAGKHMWNIVYLGGQNYLVDPTNCDEGSAGYPDMLFLKAPNAYNPENSYTFTIDKDNSITYTYDAETLATFTATELMLAGDPALSSSAKLLWQHGYMEGTTFYADGEPTETVEVWQGETFSGRLIYRDGSGRETVLPMDSEGLETAGDDIMDVKSGDSASGFLCIAANEPGRITATYQGQSLEFKVNSPVGFYAEQTDETPLDILNFTGSNDTVYLKVKDDAVTITEVERGDGVKDVERIDDGVYSVTIGTLDSERITVLVSGTMGDRVPISLPVNDLSPGLVWYWLERGDDGWQENGPARYWDEEQGNTAVGYFAYSRYPLPEHRLNTMEELQQLTFDRVHYYPTYDVGGSVDYVTLAFDEIGVATIYSNSEPGSPLKIRVNKPEVFFAADSAGENPMLHYWNLYSNNDTAYICWPEDFVVTTITPEGGSSNEAEIAIDESGRYAAVTLHEISEDWLEFSIHGAWKDHPENMQTYRVSIRLEDYRPGLRFFWVEGDWYEGTVDDVGNEPQRRLELAPGQVAYIQLNFQDGQGGSQPVTDLENVKVSGAVSLEKTVQGQYLALQGVDFGSGAITYTVDGEKYSLPVSVKLPDVGFYSSPEASKDTYLRNWVYDGTDKTNTIYLAATNGFKITELSGDSGAAELTLSEDGTYATIQLTGAQDGIEELLRLSASLMNGNVQDTRDLDFAIYYSNLSANIELPKEINGSGFLQGAILRDENGQQVDGVDWRKMDRNRLLFNYTQPGDYLLEVSWSDCVTRTVPVTVKEGVAASVSVPLLQRGNVNAADGTDLFDMQCLFDYLSRGTIDGALADDEPYFRAVADVNEDELVNILDYQALYEIVKARPISDNN